MPARLNSDLSVEVDEESSNYIHIEHSTEDDPSIGGSSSTSTDDDVIIIPPPTQHATATGGDAVRPSSRGSRSSPSRMVIISDAITATPTTAASGSRGDRSASFSYEELASRPRSNPRTRTPRRYESPLAPTLNRLTIRHDDDDDDEGRRRPGLMLGAGSVVGSRPTLTSSTTDQTRHRHLRSSKQSKPSRRKVRRWENDNLVGIASELASSGTDRGIRAADALLRAEADFMNFLLPNHPLEYRSSFADLVTGSPGCDAVKERFLRGETAAVVNSNARDSSSLFMDGDRMFKENMKARLRNVVVRATSRHSPTSSSSFVVKVLNAFESFLVEHCRTSEDEWLEIINNNNKVERDDILKGLLLCSPSVVATPCGNEQNLEENKKKRVVIRFLFNDDVKKKSSSSSSSNSSFNRLLLHAVCQFHGLSAVSKSTTQPKQQNGVNGEEGETKRARQLTVSGTCRGCQFRIVDCALRFGGDGSRKTETKENKGNEL